MGQATIFAGQKIKTLKSTLNLNGGADVISSTVDPTSVATSAEPGSLLLNTTSGKLYRKNDSGSSTNWSEVGSGGSGINYISNPSAATNTTGWNTYLESGAVTFQDAGDTVTLNNHGFPNGTIVSFTSITSTTGISINTSYYVISSTTNTFQLAQTLGGSALPLTTNGSGVLNLTAPRVGTGGSPNVTWTRSTTTPLRGSADFNFAKDAANRQGQGVSTDFTIDLADQAKVLTVTFDYEVLSGTYADGDLTVYLIADPAGTPVVIQPAGYVVQNVTVGTKMKQIATFQTQATGQSYRLCFHVASVSALAYTLAIDNVVVGPQVVQYGAPVTDWVSYTPNFTGFGTVTNLSVYSRRVGDSLEIQGYFTAPSPTATLASMTLGFNGSNGNVIAAVGTRVAATTILGLGSAGAVPSTTYFNGLTVLSDTSSSSLVRFGIQTSVNSSMTPQNGNVIVGAGSVISFTFTVPISGWSSTVQMSNDIDTRVVAARYTNSTNQACPALGYLTFDTRVFDTHSAFSGTNYTVPISGIYEIKFYGASTGSPFGAATQAHPIYLGIDGGVAQAFAAYVADAAGTTYEVLSGSTIAQVRAGQTLQIVAGNNGIPYTLTNLQVEFKRLSGPSAIAASETVAMRAYKNTGAHTNNGNNQTVASYNASPFDTHGAFNVTTGEYTVPVSGTYLVAGTIGFSPNATGVRALQIEVDLSRKLGGEVRTADGANVNTLNFSGLVTAIAGQKITVSTFQNSGGNLNYDTTSNFNSLSIVRVGN